MPRRLVSMKLAFVVVVIVGLIQQRDVHSNELNRDNSSNLSDYYELSLHDYKNFINTFFKGVLAKLKHVQDIDYFYANVNDKTKAFSESVKSLSPVILVPGYGGSKLEGKWNKEKSEYSCPTSSDWRLVWCDPRYLVWNTKCLVENFKLEFDPNTNTTHNPEGVEIRVKEPNELESVERITEGSLLGRFNYFTSISSRLTETLGYTRNVNLRAAPYDFRKAPNELTQYFNDMSKMVEKMYKQNSKRRITFICHSMGCNNILYMLQKQTHQWKHKYVRRLISLAAPWGGSMNALRAVAFGDNLKLPLILRESLLNVVQRSLPSSMYMFPNRAVFADRALIKTYVDYPTNKTEALKATLEDYEKFFKKLEHPDGYKMYLQTKDLLDPFKAPEVEVWCLFGHKIETLIEMNFSGDFPNSIETKIANDGDGTVSDISLKHCQHWTQKQQQPVHLRAYEVNHLEILADQQVLKEIELILDEDSSFEQIFEAKVRAQSIEHNHV